MEIEIATSQVFRIPDSRFTDFQEKVAKLSRRAQKLMGALITVTVIRVLDVERQKPVRRNPEAVGGWDMQGTGEFDRFHLVTVSGPTPKLSGWKFVAALDTLEADGEKMVLVRAAPGETLPEHYRNDTSGSCDHCKTDRRRKTRYVLRKVEV